MKELNNEELMNVSGGAVKIWALIGIGIFAFAAGVVDGYLRPLKCN